VGDVYAGADVQTAAYLVTPSNEELHPWLSRVAKCFQAYRYKHARLEFKPTGSTAVASSVTCSFNSDPSALPDETVAAAADRDGSDTMSAFCAGGTTLKTTASSTLGEKRYVEDVTGDLNGVLGDVATIATGIAQIVTGATNIFSAAVATKISAKKLARVSQKPPGVDVKDPPAEPVVIGQLYIDYEVEFYSPELAPDPDKGVTKFIVSDDDEYNPWSTTTAPFIEGWTDNPLRMTAEQGVTGVSHFTKYRFQEAGTYIISCMCDLVTSGTPPSITPSAHDLPYSQWQLAGISGDDEIVGWVTQTVLDNGADAAGAVKRISMNGWITVPDANEGGVLVGYLAGNVPGYDLQDGFGGYIAFTKVEGAAAAMFRQWGAIAKARTGMAVSGCERSKGFFELRRAHKDRALALEMKEARGQLREKTGKVDPYASARLKKPLVNTLMGASAGVAAAAAREQSDSKGAARSVGAAAAASSSKEPESKSAAGASAAAGAGAGARSRKPVPIAVDESGKEDTDGVLVSPDAAASGKPAPKAPNATPSSAKKTKS
jgi:hypothetical protein